MWDTFGCVHSLSLGLIGRRVRKPPEIAIFGSKSNISRFCPRDFLSAEYLVRSVESFRMIYDAKRNGFAHANSELW